ncbi:MAG: transcription elongation factor Spt5 [Desulfurococcales archaeon]|nr:transcription elongation factor Spt5 [Desulfurococcales archaeon]MEB3788418.1 transcription elongation factor Spt5 [Desulfurococcales archaeon]
MNEEQHQYDIKTRFYAIPVTGSTELKVAMVFAERTQVMGLDVRSIVVPAGMKGYVIVELGNPGDLYDLIRGVRNVKRRRPLLMKPEEVVKLARPVVEIPELKRDQIVEIIGGPFKGMRGRVVEVYESRGEVDLVLLESEFHMVITVPIEQVKLAESE